MMSGFTDSETVGHHIYFMMYCVAGRDGKNKQEEWDAIAQRAEAQMLRLTIRDGAHRETEIVVRENTILEEAWLFYEDTNDQGTTQSCFMESVQTLLLASDNKKESLAEVYISLVNVAASDDDIGFEEQDILDFVKNEWGL